MKLGVIGVGNMGTAIVKGYIAGGASPADIWVCEHNTERRDVFAAETGVGVCETVSELAEITDGVLIAVKPNHVRDVIAEMKDRLADKVLMCIAAGMTLEQLIEAGGQKVVRIMPNTPAQVGGGMSALCRNEKVTDEEFEEVLKVFQSVGKAREVQESLIDAVTGLSGSGPAYVYLFIEALADGGVLAGMTRDMAMEFAAQTVYGAAKMVIETGRHPGDLKDAVCSPAGTTIEGVRNLEAGGFRSTVIEAVMAAAERSEEMKNN